MTENEIPEASERCLHSLKGNLVGVDQSSEEEKKIKSNVNSINMEDHSKNPRGVTSSSDLNNSMNLKHNGICFIDNKYEFLNSLIEEGEMVNGTHGKVTEQKKGANMSFNPDHSVINSFVLKKKVEITKADLGIFLNLRTEGIRPHTLTTSNFDWTEVNRVIREVNFKEHLPKVATLVFDAHIIQHILRTSKIPKAGDRVNITPLLSTVTYFIMNKQPINEAQLLIDYIYGLSEIGHVTHKRKKNIALGHLVSYILEKKYDLIHPDKEFEELLYYNDASFRVIFNKEEPRKTHVVISESEEAEPTHACEPNYQDLVQRFDSLETHFDQRGANACKCLPHAVPMLIVRFRLQLTASLRFAITNLLGLAIVAPDALSCANFRLVIVAALMLDTTTFGLAAAVIFGHNAAAVSCGRYYSVCTSDTAYRL
ncbi:hypothetical protein MA16_Dca008084 [Dendrobium catenatum]|uniref:Uncharacterized protein n=1 Tax=Dendrobium catenatum TaxID=906689 RepID=A0A2I0WCY3_9ASPA|nr:hypothetical protein MA16_Dca008084 [Dendrobium catenatum]